MFNNTWQKVEGHDRSHNGYNHRVIWKGEQIDSSVHPGYRLIVTRPIHNETYKRNRQNFKTYNSILRNIYLAIINNSNDIGMILENMDDYQ